MEPEVAAMAAAAVSPPSSHQVTAVGAALAAVRVGSGGGRLRALISFFNFCKILPSSEPYHRHSLVLLMNNHFFPGINILLK